MATITIKQPAARANTKIALASLSLVILVGAALRFFQLNGQSIWYDEAYAIDLAKQPIQMIVENIQPAYLPFHPVLLRVWIILMGQSEIAVRLLSLVFGVATIPVTYVLGKRMFNSWVGLVASVIVAVSPFMVYYSQEAKMYSLLGFQAVTTTYLLLRALDGDRRWWLAYALVSATLLYNHYYGVLFFVSQSAFTLVWFLTHLRAEFTRRALAPWILVEASLCLLFLPWALQKMNLFDTFISSDAGASVGEFMFWKTIIAFTVGQSLGTLNPSFTDPIYHYHQELAAKLAWGPLLVAVLGTIATFPWFPSRKKDGLPTEAQDTTKRSWLLVITLLLVTSAAIYLASLNKRGYNPRYIITLAPFFYLLVACGSDLMRRKVKLLLVPLVVFILGAMLFSLNHYYFDPQYAREDFRSAAVYLRDHVQPNEAIICSADYSQQAIAYYLDGNETLVGLPSQVPMDRMVTEKELARLASQYQYLWLVLWQDYYSDPNANIYQWLQSHAIPTGGQQSFHGGIRVQGFLTTPPIVDAVSVPNLYGESFGGKIELVGYDFSIPKQGQTWSVTWYLRALAPLDKDYTLFMHLIGPGNQAWTQRDTQPYAGGYPTSKWKPGEIVKVETSLDIPAFSPLVDYRLEFGLYDSATSGILKNHDQDRIVFEPITITEGTAMFPPGTSECQYDFGEQMSLRGYKIDVNGRKNLTVITYWRSLSAAGKNCVVTIQLLDQAGQIVAQKKSSPSLSSYPTSAWLRGQTNVDFRWLQLPPELQSGTYRLAVDVQDAQSNQSLTVKPNMWSSAQKNIELSSVEIH